MASPIRNLIHPPEVVPPPPPLSSAFTFAAHEASHDMPDSRSGLSPILITTPVPPNGATSDIAAQDHSSSRSLYQCADCLRRYSRPEHLQRHIASHTLGKRFSCDICLKAFSRADLLKRHRANHTADNGTKRRRLDASSRGSRVAHACQACAKARVKCEERKPCSRCKDRGLACESVPSRDPALHLLHLSINARNATHEQHRPGTKTATSTPKRTPPSLLNQQGASILAQPPYRSQDTSQSAACQPLAQSSPLSSRCPTTGGTQPTMPETALDTNSSDMLQPAYPNSGAVDMEKMPFSNFLRDVLYYQSPQDQTKVGEAQGLAVLDFCEDVDTGLKDINFSVMDHWIVDGLQPSHNEPDAKLAQVDAADAIDITIMWSSLVKIWLESPWRWAPRPSDNAFGEQPNLLTPPDITDPQIPGHGGFRDRVVKDKLQASAHDKILAIVLSTCPQYQMMTRVASCFPAADLLDSCIHLFLASHQCEVSCWIHYGSFSMNAQWPEWLASTASAGAVLAPVSAMRRFGFALQEAVRLFMPGQFEKENIKITDLSMVQALIVTQDVGLWSGNRRKMEICECHMAVPVAMMRYRGRFQRCSYPIVVINATDEGKVLQDKWKRWYENESWKRLGFHAFLRDAQLSMTQFNNPNMSYAELSLPLPYSRDLWFARTAEEFKMHYLEAGVGECKRPPCVGDVLRDVQLLVSNHDKIDVQFAISILLHAFWGLILEFRQNSKIFGAPGPQASDYTRFLLVSRHEDLCKQLHNFQLATLGWHEISARESIVLHLLNMNLHVSLNDLQLFSGKEGEEQARRTYSDLQRWSGSPDSRRALWHAGQILRQAKMFPAGHLKNFYAIAVHHSALCLWTYGVVTKASRRDLDPILTKQSLIYLDGEHDALVQRFIDYGERRGAIRGPRGRSEGVPGAESLLEDPSGCMEIAQEILRVNFLDSQEALPPINENLIHMLKQLSNAAWRVGLG